MAKEVLHEPQLDTIMMVEHAISEAKSYPTRKALWMSLPKKIQYQTFSRVLDYLESSNKIAMKGNKIIWIFPDNPRLRRLLSGSTVLK